MKHFIIHWTFPQLTDCLNNLRLYSNILAITLFRKTSFSSLFLKMALISFLINSLAGSETLLLNQFLILYQDHLYNFIIVLYLSPCSVFWYYSFINKIMFQNLMQAYNVLLLLLPSNFSYGPPILLNSEDFRISSVIGF